MGQQTDRIRVLEEKLEQRGKVASVLAANPLLSNALTAIVIGGASSILGLNLGAVAPDGLVTKEQSTVAVRAAIEHSETRYLACAQDLKSEERAHGRCQRDHDRCQDAVMRMDPRLGVLMDAAPEAVAPPP